MVSKVGRISKTACLIMIHDWFWNSTIKEHGTVIFSHGAVIINAIITKGAFWEIKTQILTSPVSNVHISRFQFYFFQSRRKHWVFITWLQVHMKMRRLNPEAKCAGSGVCLGKELNLWTGPWGKPTHFHRHFKANDVNYTTNFSKALNFKVWRLLHVETT